MIAGMLNRLRKNPSHPVRFTSFVLLVVIWLTLLGSLFPPQPAAVSAQESNTPEEATSLIETSTPAADGSIVHIVKPGEFIITIAQAYQIPLIDIFSLNNLTDQSVIFPGQKLLIKRADRTPEPPPTETAIATTPPPSTPTPTRRPTRTPPPTSNEVNEAESSETAAEVVATPTIVNEIDDERTDAAEKLDPMLMMIGGLFAFGAVMVLIGSVFRRRKV